MPAMFPRGLEEISNRFVVCIMDSTMVLTRMKYHGFCSTHTTMELDDGTRLWNSTMELYLELLKRSNRTLSGP